jgi:hypothetical protein
MPDVVRISPTKIVCVLRRKNPGNWIDAYVTNDNGASWEFLSKVVQFVDDNNGNPPSIVRLRDGRLVSAYAYRASPYGIRAKVSYDEGATWSDEIHLRDDALGPDIGYCQMVQISDGKIVTMYYYRTLMHAIGQNIPYDSMVVIFGCNSDKDIHGMLRELQYGADKVIFTRSNSPKAVSGQALAELYEEISGKMCQAASCLGEALQLAKSVITRGDLICITGSFYLIGEARNRYRPQTNKASA